MATSTPDPPGHPLGVPRTPPADQPDRFLVHRRARTHPPPLPTGELLVAAPPAVARSAPAAATWLQYLVPLLGGAGSLAFLFAVPGPRHPLLVAAVAGTAVASLALGIGLRLIERRTARRARRRERSRYLTHLAQVAAAADHLAAAQLAAADHLHPDPPRLWALVCRAERLWERRPADDDFLTVRVGRGPLPLHTPVRLDAAGGPLGRSLGSGLSVIYDVGCIRRRLGRGEWPIPSWT